MRGSSAKSAGSHALLGQIPVPHLGKSVATCKLLEHREEASSHEQRSNQVHPNTELRTHFHRMEYSVLVISRTNDLPHKAPPSLRDIDDTRLTPTKDIQV